MGTISVLVVHPDGTVDTVEQLTGLPIPPPPEPDPMAEMQATIDALLDALGGSDG